MLTQVQSRQISVTLEFLQVQILLLLLTVQPQQHLNVLHIAAAYSHFERIGKRARALDVNVLHQRILHLLGNFCSLGDGKACRKWDRGLHQSMSSHLFLESTKFPLQCEDTLVTKASGQVNFLIAYWHIDVNWLCGELFELVRGQKLDCLFSSEE